MIRSREPCWWGDTNVGANPVIVQDKPVLEIFSLTEPAVKYIYPLNISRQLSFKKIKNLYKKFAI